MNLLYINPNRGGGGGGEWNPPFGREIGCHFSQELPRDLKILDLFKNDVGPRMKESF